MVKYLKWLGIFGILIVILACFIPWVYIPSKNITITGFKAMGTNFGKPGLLHIFLSIFILLGFIIPKIWIKRTNVFLCAINFAFAIRNYLLITACFAGECPEKKLGIFLILISSIIMMITALFPNIDLKSKSKNESK